MDTSEVSLQAVDYAVMALYMLVLIGIGLYYRRFAQESLENYFLGGRRLKGWVSGTSYAVTCMNADVAPSYCGMTVITGGLRLLVVSESLRAGPDDRRPPLRRLLAPPEPLYLA